MKKQINPSIKAHLLRSALILLSLVAFNQDIFCQTPTPTATPTPTPTPASTECPRATPGVCTSYEAESNDNTLTGSAFVLSCPTCNGSPPAKVGYVGNNSGILQFNAIGVVAPGTHSMTICYTNGDAVRYAYLRVNGGPGMPVSFPSTGSFETVGSIQITVVLNTGCNTLEFYNPIVGSWAPDFDQIQFNCPTCTVSAPAPTPTATLTTDGASNITRSSAILNGTVNPNGLTTTVYFQYGKRTNYGSTTANQTYTGNTTQSVSVRIRRLRANTKYHFRLVETSNGVTSYGSDRTFRTRR